MAAGSLPNRVCQYPAVRIIASGAPGASSCFVNSRVTAAMVGDTGSWVSLRRICFRRIVVNTAGFEQGSRVPQPDVFFCRAHSSLTHMKPSDHAREAWQRFVEAFEPLRPELYRYCRF